MATVSTSREIMPMAWDGKKRWKGNKNPVTLVATVVQINTAVQPLSGFDVNNPNMTTNPASIPSKLNKTCTKVKIVIPKIISAPFAELPSNRPKDRYHTPVTLGVQIRHVQGPGKRQRLSCVCIAKIHRMQNADGIAQRWLCHDCSFCAAAVSSASGWISSLPLVFLAMK